MDTPLDSVLRHYDALSTPFAENDVAAALRNVSASEDTEAGVARTAEAIAFGVCEEYTNRQPGWGTYYGPMFVVPGEGGTVFESPSIQLVIPEVLEYWLQRAAEARNPILKIRYADIAWDMWPGRGTGPRPIAAAQIAVDETVRLLTGPPRQHPADLVKKARRALGLAIQINDAGRIAQVARAMVDLEERVGEDGNPGLWGFCMEELVSNPKVTLNRAEEERIVGALEERLGRIATAGSPTFNAFATEAAVEGLLPYYRRGAPSKIANLLALYLEAFRAAGAGTDPLTATHWLTKVARLLRQEGLSREADSLEPEIRSLAVKARGMLGTLSTPSEISAEDMERYLTELLGSTLEEALVRVAIQLVPGKQEAADLQENLLKEHPIGYLMPASILDHRGMVVAEIPPYAEDPDSHLVRQIALNLTITGIFLNPTIDGLLNKYLGGRAEGLVAALEQRAGLFTMKAVALLQAALRAYDAERWIDCIHCFVTLIEALVRRNVEVVGGILYRPRRPNGFVPRQLDELLRDGALAKFWEQEDVPLYLRVLLTDVRGWNIRNLVCHGEFEPEGFSRRTANHLLHAVLVLGLVRRTEEESPR
jgi:Domain of unknown function (DUF4209)